MKQRARAIIVEGNKILLINRIKGKENYWVFPGGGIEPGESKEEALIRECQEELGLEVKVKDLILERMSDKPGMEEHREYFFTVEVLSGRLGSGKGPEFEKDTNYKGQYIISWVDIKDWPDINLKPFEVRDLVLKNF
ncbi:MAG: NUDIX domain-containing protein [Candidatus Buchananbacteria bacterium]